MKSHLSVYREENSWFVDDSLSFFRKKTRLIGGISEILDKSLNVATKKALITYDEKSFKDAETCVLLHQDKFGWATYEVEFLEQKYQFSVLVKFMWISATKAPKNLFMTVECA